MNYNYFFQVFVHVSTAFNNLDKGEIEETIYPASLNPEKLIEFVEEMDDKLLGSITKQCDALLTINTVDNDIIF